MIASGSLVVPNEAQLGSRVRYSQSLTDDSFDPIPFDQGVLDDVVANDAALSNVNLRAQPKVNPDLDYFGESYWTRDLELNTPIAHSDIGSKAFRNRQELIGTIVHEDTHLRFAERLRRGGERTMRIDRLGLEEEYVISIEKRFLQMQARRLENGQ